MDVAYEVDCPEGYFIEGCLSRKKHIVPEIMSIIES